MASDVNDRHETMKYHWIEMVTLLRPTPLDHHKIGFIEKLTKRFDAMIRLNRKMQ